jgi:hypothetical protein
LPTGEVIWSEDSLAIPPSRRSIAAVSLVLNLLLLYVLLVR